MKSLPHNNTLLLSKEIKYGLILLNSRNEVNDYVFHISSY